MRLVNLALVSLLLPTIVLANLPTANRGGSRPLDVANEIRRGFHASALCFQAGRHPRQWCSEFQRILADNAQRGGDTDGFLLGVKFGFSFRVESSGEVVGASENELRRLAIRGTLARLDFEKKKKQLGLTDADIVRLIGVDEKKFAEWKTRVLTSDTDRSLLKRGLNL
jgi:hypothetical protein